jgi:hypothetical protein
VGYDELDGSTLDETRWQTTTLPRPTPAAARLRGAESALMVKN